jgi:hypothetical protein
MTRICETGDGVVKRKSRAILQDIFLAPSVSYQADYKLDREPRSSDDGFGPWFTWSYARSRRQRKIGSFWSALALVGFAVIPWKFGDREPGMQVGFSPGSLVRVRGRDWIVLPAREPSVLHLRPLTRGHADEIGIHLPIEGRQVTSAEFVPPAPAKPGDATGVMALLNAARLSALMINLLRRTLVSSENGR